MCKCVYNRYIITLLYELNCNDFFVCPSVVWLKPTIVIFAQKLFHVEMINFALWLIIRAVVCSIESLSNTSSALPSHHSLPVFAIVFTSFSVRPFHFSLLQLSSSCVYSASLTKCLAMILNGQTIQMHNNIWSATTVKMMMNKCTFNVFYAMRICYWIGRIFVYSV